MIGAVSGGLVFGDILNDTHAYIAGTTRAARDVQVSALSDQEVFSVGVSAAGAVAPLGSGSLSIAANVWGIGSNYSGEYSADGNDDDALADGEYDGESAANDDVEDGQGHHGLDGDNSSGNTFKGDNSEEVDGHLQTNSDNDTPIDLNDMGRQSIPVSYTHLTLPTKA